MEAEKLVAERLRQQIEAGDLRRHVEPDVLVLDFSDGQPGPLQDGQQIDAGIARPRKARRAISPAQLGIALIRLAGGVRSRKGRLPSQNRSLRLVSASGRSLRPENGLRLRC